MKISKITKVLPIALAFTVCSVFANGADEATSAVVDYQLKLNDYIKISVDNAKKQSETTFGANYGSINITTPLTSKFTVISNANERNLLLKGTCVSSGDETAIKFIDENTFNLVFTNTTHVPDEASVQNIKGTPAANSNANAIAFKVTLTANRVDGPDADTAIATTEFDDTNDGIKYTVKNGKLTLDYVVDSTNVTNTFNTQDMSGTYKSTLTLSDLSAQ